MQKSELWLVGINEEYCWQHKPGNWDCIPCRVAVTLPEFFAALGRYVAQAEITSIERDCSIEEAMAAWAEGA